MPGPAIGIDLGTTYSCVAVWEHDAVTIIANKLGHRTTPSWVSYYNGERLVGEAARAIAQRNPKCCIFDSKRLIGCKVSDPVIQQDISHFPFKVVAGENDNPLFQVDFDGKPLSLTPEQIGAAILTHMKGVAEDYLGCEVTKAVVTVPSYFSDSQRQSTKDAGAIAGLEIIRLINEPTAAAIAYGLTQASEEARNVLVFDLGGGTLDVTVLTVEHGVFEVLATCGDTHLGGEDFDNNLLRHCMERFQAQGGADISRNARALKRLKEKCQEAKHALSSNLKVDIFIESFADDVDLDLLITRQQFEAMNQELFDRCIAPVDAALEYAKLSPEDIGDILLIGGSTRIPYIETILEQKFPGKKCSRRINPDEAVAYGAAIVAANATMDYERKKEDSKLGSLTLMDVIPMTLGIELHDGRMSELIPANTTIPYKHSKIYHNDEDEQTEVEVLIYEGASKIATHNKLLGCFTVQNLPPKPRGQLDIEVTFAVDVNGILQVTAKVLGFEGLGGETTISANKGLLTDSAIVQKCEEEQRFTQQLLAKKKMDQLEELLASCKHAGVASDAVTKANEWLRETREQVAPAQYASKLSEIDGFLATVQGLLGKK